MSEITFSEEGWDDYIYWQAQDKKTLLKINKLLKSISRDGALNGEGKPEKLKHKDGEYSRRIDKEKWFRKLIFKTVLSMNFQMTKSL